MATTYYDSVIHIPNGSWIGIRNLEYDFGYKDNIILFGCSNYSYLSGKIIALKKDDKVIVYSTNITYIGNLKTVEKLLEFTSYSHVAYGKIICERNTYLIDSNCQIKFSSRAHIN